MRCTSEVDRVLVISRVSCVAERGAASEGVELRVCFYKLCSNKRQFLLKAELQTVLELCNPRQTGSIIMLSRFVVDPPPEARVSE